MAVDWVLVDYASWQANARVTYQGIGRADFPPLDGNEMWQVSRAVVACDGQAGQPTCVLHVVSAGVDPSPASQRSGTRSGSFDEADYPGDGLTVQPDEQLIAVWTGAEPGATCIATIHYRHYIAGSP